MMSVAKSIAEEWTMSDSTDNTLVIGDTHGHLDRIIALLTQEGLLNKGSERIRPEVQLIHLGDLCHLGTETAESDRETMEVAPAWFDVILWGNHDRAIVSQYHNFGGYRWSYYSGGESYGPEKSWFQRQYLDLAKSGKLKLAHEKHGYLLTHAGLHPKFLDHPMSAENVAHWLNDEVLPNDDKVGVRDAVSFERGGSHYFGGVLWRDQKEDLYDGFSQIFGHSAHPYTIRTFNDDTNKSYCIDIGQKAPGGELAGIWLPSETVVRINLDTDTKIALVH